MIIKEAISIVESLSEFKLFIHGGVDGELYYMDITKDRLYKWQYNAPKPNDEKGKHRLYRFWLIPELGNTFRLIDSIVKNSTEELFPPLDVWYSKNKNNIEILSTKQAKRQKIKLKEGKNCWKTTHQLVKMIKNGFEVPNCIPDNAYSLDESQIFLNKKPRDLNQKYKKAFTWFQDVVMDGDKEFAEKLLQIIDKWKQSYDSKIKSAKSMLKEAFFDKEINRELSLLPKYRKITLEEFKKYYRFITSEYKGDEKYYQLTRLEKWRDKMLDYLDACQEHLENDDLVHIEFEHFGFIDNLEESLKINEISPSKLKSAVQRLNRKEEYFKKELNNLTNSEDYNNATNQAKKEMLDILLRRHVGGNRSSHLKESLEDDIKKKSSQEIKERISDPQTVFDWIADFFKYGGKVTPNSFNRNLDRNFFIEKLNFISKDGKGIDIAAMQISDDSQMPVSDEDIVEFILHNKSVSDYWEKERKKIESNLFHYWGEEQFN